MTGKLIDLDGRKFHHLTATNQTRRRGKRTERLFYCDCGAKTWVVTHQVMIGHTKSCGCWKKKFKRLGLGRAARNEVFDTYKRDAAKRKFEWRLTDEQFDHLTSQQCTYCHRPPGTARNSRRDTGWFVYNGLDRVDPKKGYFVENVVTCCQVCNRAKSDMSLEEFMQWVADLSEAYTNG